MFFFCFCFFKSLRFRELPLGEGGKLFFPTLGERRTYSSWPPCLLGLTSHPRWLEDDPFSEDAVRVRGWSVKGGGDSLTSQQGGRGGGKVKVTPPAPTYPPPRQWSVIGWGGGKKNNQNVLHRVKKDKIKQNWPQHHVKLMTFLLFNLKIPELMLKKAGKNRRAKRAAKYFWNMNAENQFFGAYFYIDDSTRAP